MSLRDDLISLRDGYVRMAADLEHPATVVYFDGAPDREWQKRRARAYRQHVKTLDRLIAEARE